MNYLINKEQIKNILELFISWNGEIETIDIANLDSAVDFISKNLASDNVEDIKKINGLVKEDAEYYFPELKEKESEDDRIRKAILNYLTKMWGNCNDNVCGVHVEDAIAWLEKQCKHFENFDEAEKEKSAFVGGCFIACKADFLDFKEGETYLLEYIGDDNYNVRSDNLLGKTYHITPGQLYCLFAQQHCPKENNVNEETNAPTAYGKYVDECLNEAAKHFFSEGEDTYTVADLFYAGIRCRQSWLEKQAKQTNVELSQKEVTKISDHELEPKFHPGDWITHNTANFVFKIINVSSNGYVVVNRENYKKTISFDNENNYRLWTIQDAKDGDVLATSSGAFIYNGNNGGGGSPGSYCGINTLGRFQLGSETHWARKKVYPATKEQREVLFQKMKEADCKWDSEKKELKTIEQKPEDKVKSKFKVDNYIVLNDDIITSSEIWKVINIDKDGYYNIQCITNPEYDEIYRVPGFVIEQDYRLWTIQDAKDGDVLSVKIEDEVFIVLFNQIHDRWIITHCCYSETTSKFIEGAHFCYHYRDLFMPATKEQRDILEMSVINAGYEWNSVSKELKRITKFKVGDWIVSNDGIFTGMITEVYDYGYRDTNGYFNKCLEDNYHLWTIQDAKCGDVLISSNKQPFVYNGNYTSDSLGSDSLSGNYTSGSLGAYFGLTLTGELLICDSHSNNWTDLTGVQPATEEQRNMLFKKLHDSDYKWDSEKEELWHKYL